MTEQQKKLIKATVPILQEHGLLLSQHFYRRMFSGNPELKHVFNMGNQQNNKQQTALAMTVLAYAEHIDNPSALLPVFDTIGQKHTSLNIRAEQYQIVGKHLIASIKEVLGAEASVDLLDAWEAAYNELASLMSNREKGIYHHQAQKNGGWTGWRKFVLKKKIIESSEIISFYFHPEDNQPIIIHNPGQYISIKLFLPELNLTQPRQYSISSAPNSEYYRISVKRETGSTHPDGMISTYLHDHLKIGDTLELSAPSGTFVLNQDNSGPKVFISGGVGQTPLLSMLEKLTTTGIQNSVMWIHGCRNEEVHAFKDKVAELVNINRKLQQHVFYEHSSGENNSTYSGRVDLEMIKDIVINPDSEYYICGPAPFITMHYNFLIKNGVHRSSIYFEEFGPSSLQLN